MTARRKRRGPPGLSEDPEQLAGEAAAGGDPAVADDGPRASHRERARPGRRPGRPPGRPRKGDRFAFESVPPGASVPPPVGGEVTFPVEALAFLHLELWNVIAVRLRSRWALSPEGAAEMARYGEIMIRQYLGPYLAEHAALAAYAVTQCTALVAVMAMRDTSPAPSKSPPDVPVDLPLSGLAVAAGASA